MVSWMRATRLVTMVTLGLQAHPHLAVLEVLLLPDRHRLLQGIDGEAAGLEGLAAVGRGHRDHHARLPDLEAADAMHEGDAVDDGPAAANGRRDLPQRGERHRRVGLVLEELDPPTPGLVAHHSREEREGARARVLHRLGERTLREGLGGDLDPVRVRRRGAAAHRWAETELIAVYDKKGRAPANKRGGGEVRGGGRRGR